MPIDHTKNIIEVRDVSFHYGTTSVLEHITLDIHSGDYLGIIGPNGGGKTTLLKIMLGLIRPESGTVSLFGVDIGRFRDWYRIGYVPQKAVSFDAQFPATVSEVVTMGNKDRSMIQNALADVDMMAYADRLIGKLSPGQQQRVFIARALASNPDVLFLDEPTVGVDANTQEQFYLLLKTLNQTRGLTLVLVSHDIDVVASQATELACINGRLVCHGPPKEFNANKYIQDLYGKEIKFIVHDH